jgi:glucose/arabinose dehydrogenase
MNMLIKYPGHGRREVASTGVRGELVSRLVAAIAAAPIMMGGIAGAGPVVNSAYTSQLRLSTSAAGVGHVTQFAAGPDGRIYASTSDRGVLSFQYNAASGRLTDEKSVSSLSGLGIGFQKSTGQMYLSTFDGSIYRLSDDNRNGSWGESGETRVPIVQNLPPGDHNTDNIQIVGDTLYVGIGDRTINGGTGVNTGGSIDDYGGKGMFYGGNGTTFGESAYNGTISWIRDLKAVPSTPNAAGLFADNSQATIQSNSLPFTSDDPGKLVVHSAGTRNPFGLAVDASGNLYFTNNYDRAETNGDGTANKGHYADAVGASLKNAVYDQFFKAVPGADYGFRNENWRDNTPVLTPGSPGYDHQKSLTFDNLYSNDPNYLQTYDPTHPVGLGPSSSSDGVAFSYNSALPADLVGDAFVARYNPSVTSQDGETLIYSDLVAIDPITGLMNQVAAGFENPLAVFADANGNLLVSDYGTGDVYFLRAVPEPSTILMTGLGVLGLAGAALRKKSARNGETRG